MFSIHPSLPAREFVRSHCLSNGLSLDDQAEDEAVTSIASVLAGLNRPGNEYRQDLYSSAIYLIWIPPPDHPN